MFRQAEIDIEIAIEVSNPDFSVSMPEARLQNKLRGRESAAKRECVSDTAKEQQQPLFRNGCGRSNVVSSQVKPRKLVRE